MVVAPNIIRTIKTSKGDATYSTYDLLDEIKSRPVSINQNRQINP